MSAPDTSKRRNYPRSPFARFEANLARERREERLKQDVEIVGSVPKRERSRRTEKKRKETVNIEVDPRVTATAALTACRKESHTNKIIHDWLVEYAQEDRPPVVESGIKICIKLALDTPEWQSLADEINAEAKNLGMEPSDLATAFVRAGLAERRKQTSAA